MHVLVTLRVRLTTGGYGKRVSLRSVQNMYRYTSCVSNLSCEVLACEFPC